jgi:hypothetical protein
MQLTGQVPVLALVLVLVLPVPTAGGHVNTGGDATQTQTNE